MEMAIAVQPTLDLPLLKRGGKRVKNRLPDMWKEPEPVKRYEKKSVPTPQAEKTKEAIVDTRVAKADEEPPPPKAKLARRVDDMVRQMKEEAEAPNVDEEGAADGVEEGTEADPLKARAVSLYRIKLTNWFKRGFQSPLGELPCEVLKTLSTRVVAFIGAGGTVARYTLTSSGNAIFDARVKAVMDQRVGQSVPPPPPNYPAILDSAVHATFQGKNEQCK
jgi:hypothetical protein